MPQEIIETFRVKGSALAFEIPLKNIGGRELVNDAFSLIPPDVSFYQNPLDRDGRKPLVPSRYFDVRKFFLKFSDEYQGFFRCPAGSSVHVIGNSDDYGLARVFLGHATDFSERFRARALHDLKRQGDGAGFIAYGDANSFFAQIKTQNSHFFQYISCERFIQARQGFEGAKVFYKGKAFVGARCIVPLQ